jgi:hypothetical protein
VRLAWKEGIGHTEPEKCCQIQEALPIIRGRLIVVEVMLAHYAKGLPTVAKLNVEVTQHHHLVSKGLDLQVAK